MEHKYQIGINQQGRGDAQCPVCNKEFVCEEIPITVFAYKGSHPLCYDCANKNAPELTDIVCAVQEYHTAETSDILHCYSTALYDVETGIQQVMRCFILQEKEKAIDKLFDIKATAKLRADKPVSEWSNKDSDLPF
ncbi:MAG: hypothetical protein FWF77_06315 [Defluviitaleaceae bacterium]|nr:hypothetical protein [Defluviitaleaceae bacterium]